MATYSTFKYFTKLYGDFSPYRTSSSLFAQVLDYNRIRIIAEVPERVDSNYILVRTSNGAAEDPSDGRGTVTNNITGSVVQYAGKGGNGAGETTLLQAEDAVLEEEEEAAIRVMVWVVILDQEWAE